MILGNKIVNEISNHKHSLFQSFFPNSKYNFNLKKFKEFKKFKIVIIIGMGGSILGPKAIYFFLKHKINKKFIFIDNLDQKYLLKIKKENNLKKALFLIISKSGNTNETIINSSFFSSFFSKKNLIIISEDRENTLSNFAKNKGINLVKHHKNIGGRYSVFSDVGMLPAYLMGLEPKKFKKNIPNLIKNKKLLSGSIKKILKSVDTISVTDFEVPGAFEIPVMISKLANRYDGFIAIGCVIKGQTKNFDLISHAITDGIMQISITEKKPIGNAILTCFNQNQAKKRFDRGAEAAKAVVLVLKNGPKKK